MSKGDGTEGSASGSGAKTPDSPSKAKHIVEKVGPTAFSAGCKMYSAWNAYQNNEVLRGQAEQVRRQEAQERMQEASVTGKSAKLTCPAVPKLLKLGANSIRRLVRSLSSV